VGGATFGVWLLGVVLLSLRLILGWRQLTALRREAARADDAVPPHVWRDLRRALGQADEHALPPLLVSDSVSSPITFGLLRAVVVLPAGLPARLRESQLRDVLVHEYAHVLRRDHVVGLVQRVASIVLWPHPLVHLLNRELNRAREESCDDYVLDGHPRGPRDAASEYARALVTVAEMRGAEMTCLFKPANPFNPLRPPLPAVGILGAGWPLESRVAGLLDRRRKVMTRLHRPARVVLALAFFFTAAAVASVRLLDAAPEGEARSARPERRERRPSTRPADAKAGGVDRAAAQLERTLPEVNFNRIGFADALDFLRDVSGLNVLVDWRALEEAGIDRNTPIEYKARDVKFGAALKAVTTLAGDSKNPVTFGMAGPVVFVSTPKRVDAAVKGAAAIDAKAQDALSKELLARTLPEVKFESVVMGDVVDFLRDVSAATLYVHWKELESAGVDRNAPVNVTLKQVPFGLALHLILATSGGGNADFTVEDRQIMITCAAAVAAQAKPATAPARAAQRQ
jgi:hypothetical protein